MFDSELDDERPHRSRSPSRATRRDLHTRSAELILPWLCALAGRSFPGQRRRVHRPERQRPEHWAIGFWILAAIVAPLRMSLEGSEAGIASPFLAQGHELTAESILDVRDRYHGRGKGRAEGQRSAFHER